MPWTPTGRSKAMRRDKRLFWVTIVQGQINVRYSTDGYCPECFAHLKAGDAHNFNCSLRVRNR